jgi:hypothetical protein
MRLFPKEIDFFEIFAKAASQLTKATSLLVALMENFDDIEAKAKAIFEKPSGFVSSTLNPFTGLPRRRRRQRSLRLHPW